MAEPDRLDLRHIGLVLERNGKVIGTAVGAAVLDHPARAVAWLANKLSVWGESTGGTYRLIRLIYLPPRLIWFPVITGRHSVKDCPLWNCLRNDPIEGREPTVWLGYGKTLADIPRFGCAQASGKGRRAMGFCLKRGEERQ